MSQKYPMNNDLVSRILSSVFFKKSFGKATRLSKNSAGIFGLIKEVLNKSSRMDAGVFKTVRYKITVLIGLVRAYAKGDYREVSSKTIIAIIAALIYFLSPVDLIPDFIPMVGFADDMALLAFVFNNVRDELEKYELWEMNKDLNS